MAINAPTVVPAVITAIPIKVATNNIILTNIIVLKSGHIQQLQHLFLNSMVIWDIHSEYPIGEDLLLLNQQQFKNKIIE